MEIDMKIGFYDSGLGGIKTLKDIIISSYYIIIIYNNNKNILKNYFSLI